jgi:hypothetical protein
VNDVNTTGWRWQAAEQIVCGGEEIWQYKAGEK